MAEPQVPRTTERPGDLALLTRVGAGDVVAAEDLYDRYGAVLYALAMTVTGEARSAGRAVVAAFRTAPSTVRHGDERPWRLLASATLAACPTGPDQESRRVAALTVFGGHRLDEAAEVLGLESHDAASRLRDWLRARSAA